METASLRTLSPNTNMYRIGSTSKAWKIARVATGSTAEIRDPKANDSIQLSLYTTWACNKSHNEILKDYM